MAHRRNKRGMGPLVKEMWANPMVAVVNGVLGVGSLAGAGIIVVVRLIVRFRGSNAGRSLSQLGMVAWLFVFAVLMLVGACFCVFGLLQMNTRILVYSKGMVWHRYGKKRIILWLEVDHFSCDDETTKTLKRWTMVLRNGERVDIHSLLYNREEFRETMELIAEQIEEAKKEFG